MSPLPLHCQWPDEATTRALQTLCNEFCWLVDQGHADHTRHLFTPDVQYHAQGVASTGIEPLMLRMAERAARRDYRSRHVVSGLRLHASRPDHVLGQSLLVVYRDGPAAAASPALVADVHDQYRRSADGRWRIADRLIVPALAAPGAR